MAATRPLVHQVTRRQKSRAGPVAVPRRLAPMHTTYTAVRRIVDLAALGGEVGLLAVHRATAKAYMNRAIRLRFVAGRLVDHGVVAEPFQGRYTRGVVPLSRSP